MRSTHRWRSATAPSSRTSPSSSGVDTAAWCCRPTTPRGATGSAPGCPVGRRGGCVRDWSRCHRTSTCCGRSRRRSWRPSAASAPLVEVMSLDEAFLDVRGAARLFGPPEVIAERIRSRVRAEHGITCSVGIAAADLRREAGQPTGQARRRAGDPARAVRGDRPPARRRASSTASATPPASGCTGSV